MTKRIGIFFLALFVLASLLCTAHAQAGEKNLAKIVTLPSGKVILDMSGEWKVLYHCYGYLAGAGDSQDILTITQEGNEFVAVKQIGNEFMPKGSQSIRGELQGDGFKAIQINKHMAGWADCTGKISENGNKVVLDDGESIKATLTRK